MFRSVRLAFLGGSQAALAVAGGLAGVDSLCLVELHHGRVGGCFGEVSVVGVCQVPEVGRGIGQLLSCGEAVEGIVASLTGRLGTVAPETPP